VRDGVYELETISMTYPELRDVNPIPDPPQDCWDQVLALSNGIVLPPPGTILVSGFDPPLSFRVDAATQGSGQIVIDGELLLNYMEGRCPSDYPNCAVWTCVTTGRCASGGGSVPAPCLRSTPLPEELVRRLFSF
jgi:hypothetical protein